MFQFNRVRFNSKKFEKFGQCLYICGSPFVMSRSRTDVQNGLDMVFKFVTSK